MGWHIEHPNYRVHDIRWCWAWPLVLHSLLKLAYLKMATFPVNGFSTILIARTVTVNSNFVRISCHLI